MRTVDDFGRQGEPPSHPELLDYLAARFVAVDYSFKRMIREIVLSVPFRNTQGGVVATEPVISQKSLDISRLNALKQDAASHLNLVKPEVLAPKR